jgi:arabinogalactan endo-1,4-beta-galactosidase
MLYGFTDFAFFSEKKDAEMKDGILRQLLSDNIGHLRFGLNLYQVPSRYKYGDINFLLPGIRTYHQMGFKIHIYFFFSDDVANASQSSLPEVWKDKTLEELLTLLKADVRMYYELFERENIEIESYTLGNEVDWGICDYRPNVRIDSSKIKGDDDFEWLESNLWNYIGKIINAVSGEIRILDKKAKIVVHSDSIGKKKYTYNLFRSIVDQKVDFDVIALTYNPWTIWDEDLDGFGKISECVDDIKKLSKPIWIVEYSYPRDLITNGELTRMKPENKYGFDSKGQERFNIEFIKFCKTKKIEMLFFWRGEHEKKNGDLFWKTGVLENDRLPLKLSEI